MVALKEENKSDEENFNNSANDYQLQVINNSTEEATKLKRNKLDDSFLRYSFLKNLIIHLRIDDFHLFSATSVIYVKKI